jgi:transposase-like protein
MGQLLHGSAATTEAVRRATQHSQESLRTLARHYGINQKTVAKWKRRTSVADLPTGPREPRSTSLSVENEAKICIRRRTAARQAHHRVRRREVAIRADGQSFTWQSPARCRCTAFSSRGIVVVMPRRRPENEDAL